MRDYLGAMAQVQYPGGAPAAKPRTLLAVLGPKMLALAAACADGAQPYNVNPDRAARARAILPNFRENFWRMGFTAADLQDGGSDRPTDSILAWGEAMALAREDQSVYELLAPRGSWR
jgi:hypothetical protein